MVENTVSTRALVVYKHVTRPRLDELCHEAVVRARAATIKHGLPRKAYEAFRSQWHGARRRSIPFLFTIEEWWAWWQIDGRWEKRGLKGNGLVMARYGDIGPYSVENVYCVTAAQNCRDIPKERRNLNAVLAQSSRRASGIPHHLSYRGDDHPKSKAVLTPKGRFGSAALAGEAFGITRQYASMLAKRNSNGWSYEAG